MSERPDRDSQTEEATPRRIEDALKKGNLPVSREVGAFASIIAIAVALQIGSAFFVGIGVPTLSIFLDRPGEFSLGNGDEAAALIGAVIVMMAKIVVAPLGVLMVAGIAASLAQNPLRAALDRIKPQFSRLSPSKGAARIFGAAGRAEIVKSLAKLAILGVIVGLALTNFGLQFLDSALIGPADLPNVVFSHVQALLLKVAVCLAVLAGADLAWTRFNWRRELRMSKQEVKDEQKQVDGDPVIKARQRSLARDRARRRMIAQVPRATVVIANPTHYAIALRYVREETAAPIVVAKGLDHVALKIREVAEANGVPVIEDRALARSLYDVVVPDKPIPSEFYRAVAEIILFLMQRSGGSSAAPAKR